MSDSLVSPNIWRIARWRLAKEVHDAVSSVSPDFELKGSFARGDFHLSRRSLETFSDVDLLLADDARDRHAWEQDVASLIADHGWNIRVSVQHHDSTAGIRVDDSRLLIVGELVRFWDRMSDHAFAGYLTAKATLAMARTFELDAACADNSVRVRAESAAEQARLGYTPVFSAANSAFVLQSFVVASEPVRRLLELLETGDIETSRQWFLNSLTESSVDPWLRGRLTDLISHPSDRPQE